jgi:hypothetical protein
MALKNNTSEAFNAENSNDEAMKRLHSRTIETIKRSSLHRLASSFHRLRKMLKQ